MPTATLLSRALAAAHDGLGAALTLSTTARELVLIVGGFLATLLDMEPIFGQLLIFNTVLDVGTFWLSKGRRVRVGEGLRVALGKTLARMLENAVILGVALSFANSFVLFAYAADVAVAYTAGRAGYGALDHALKPDNDFRLFFLRAWQAALSALGFFRDREPEQPDPISGAGKERERAAFDPSAPASRPDGSGPLSPRPDA
jgi:hypothetical protein